MTGFKEGAAASGFDDESGSVAAETTDESGETDSGTEGKRTAVTESTETDSGPTGPGTSDQGPGAARLPWIYRRDNARDGRPRTKQIHLQPATAEREGAVRSAVESELGESVNLTDLREASLLVAMDHVDEVADQLREWGYDFD